MKIIRRGIVQDDIERRISCSKCGCVFEFTARESKKSISDKGKCPKKDAEKN